MINRQYLILIIIMVGGMSCKLRSGCQKIRVKKADDTMEFMSKFYLDLNNGFQNSLVKINNSYGNVIFEGKVTTEPLLSHAQRIEVLDRRANQQIHLTVNNHCFFFKVKPRDNFFRIDYVDSKKILVSANNSTVYYW